MSYKHYGPRTRRGKGWLLGVCLLLLVLILAAVGTLIWAGSRVSPDRVMPGVRACGVDMGGMDRAQVLSALGEAGYSPLEGKSLTVTLPEGERSIPASELAELPDTAQAAETVLAWGHTGSRLGDGLHWLLRRGSGEEILEAPALRLREDRLAELCREIGDTYDREPTRSIVFQEGDALEITLGVSGLRVDREALLAELETALEDGSLAAVCRWEVLPPETPDLEAVWRALHMEPVNAVFDATYSVAAEKPGRTFDLEAAKTALAEAKEGETLRIPVLTLEPEVTAETLEGLLFRDLLAVSDTPLTDNAVRTRNIEIAASMLDDTILLPGQIFSYNGALGERTEEKGYGPATAYSGGELVEEVGGGICQLSSALYYCAMLADEVILERTNHLYYQTYVPYGMDATVSWGGPDFRFQLRDGYPVRILASVRGDRLHVELWGTRTREGHVELEYTVDAVYPHGVTYYEHKRVKSGTQVITDYGRDGMQVTTYRVYYDGEGNLLERVQEAVNVYASRDRVVVVAPGERPKR